MADVTEVRTADGQEFEITGGPVGSYPWARQASLISVAYHQLGDEAKAYRWNREYDKRLALWNQVQAGADLQAVIAAATAADTLPDLLAPARIAWNAVTQAVDTVLDAGGATVGLIKWLPWIAAGTLLVAAIGFRKGSLRVSR